uniref:Putative serine/threonine protein kinase n=2 Tax=Lutzomyia longipalpis TaxID=7200 RepID=A0A7G3B0S8_LUTLO
MWSVGVFLYVFLSGVSPFLDDSEEETSANILKGDYCFPEDYFRGISAEAIVFVQKLLVLNPEERLTVDQCLAAPWIVQNLRVSVITTSRLQNFVDRRTPKVNFAVPTSKFYVN